MQIYKKNIIYNYFYSPSKLEGGSFVEKKCRTNGRYHNNSITIKKKDINHLYIYYITN